jgi:hypothetical protein
MFLQDIAAMLNRGDPARAASPLASRHASFTEGSRRAEAEGVAATAVVRPGLLGVGTEILAPQDAWDFQALPDGSGSGNLAPQLRRQVRCAPQQDGWMSWLR